MKPIIEVLKRVVERIEDDVIDPYGPQRRPRAHSTDFHAQWIIATLEDEGYKIVMVPLEEEHASCCGRKR